MKAEGERTKAEGEGKGMKEGKTTYVLIFIPHPSSFILRPSAFILPFNYYADTHRNLEVSCGH